VKRTVKQSGSWIAFHFFCGTSLVAAFACGSVARAGEADAVALGEIIVVGQQENRNIQKTAEAITALSSETLFQNHVENAQDLNGLVPALVIGESEGFQHTVSIRGIGLNAPQDEGTPPSVSFHQDGIYIVNSISLASDFLDTEHIEVLRGPQGTVFGQNAVGGTVNVITTLPDFKSVGGYGSVSFGSFNLAHATAAVNLPFSDTFAIRLAGDRIYQDGFAYATQVPGTNGKYPLSDKNNTHARITALFKPSDDFSVVLRADYSRAKEHESEAKNIADPNPNPYRETSDWPGYFSYNQTIVSATITYDMPWATFKSLSSGQWMHQVGSESDGGLDLALAQPNVATQQTVEFNLHDNQAITQEFDLSSRPGSEFTWVVGAFYLQSRFNVSLDSYVRNTYDTVNPNILNDQLESLVSTQMQDGTLYYESVATIRRTSISGFGQASHDITDALSATAGFRYTEDRNHMFDTTYFGDTNFGGGVLNFGRKATRFTYKAELDYRLTSDNFLYGSVSTGFKPGGGNLSTAPAVVPLNYKPEDITAFEVGSKNKFLDNKVTTNLAGFYYVDHNLQYHAEDLINFQGGVANLPRVDVYGIEGEFSVRLPYNFHLDGNATLESGKIATHVMTIDNLAGIAANDAFINQYGYYEFLTTEYGSPNNPVPNAAQILTGLRKAAYRDVYGNAPPNLPKVTATVALSHDYMFGNGSNLTSRLQLQYRESYYNTVFKSPIYITPGFVLANLLFDYTLPSTKWDASFAINNLADKAAVAYRMTNQYGGTTVQTYYPPREYIGSIRYRF